MTLYESTILFFATYATVFLLGFQSKNVQQSRYLLAAITSAGIGLAQYVFVKFAIDHGGALFLTVSSIGGSLGIVSSIWVHDNMGAIGRRLKRGQ